MIEKPHKVFKAPKGHRHKGIRKSPTVREFLWRLFRKVKNWKTVDKQKLCDLVNEKFKGKRTLHPEYVMKPDNIKYHLCIWRQTLKINQQAWRKM